MTLEDIGEWANALLCVTDLTTCCHPSYSGEMGAVIGNWFFPNGTKVPSTFKDNTQWDFYRTRGQMVVLMRRRRGGVNGIYRCVILDAMNVTQTIYIGVYTESTGECMVCESAIWSDCNLYFHKKTCKLYLHKEICMLIQFLKLTDSAAQRSE